MHIQTDASNVPEDHDIAPLSDTNGEVEMLILEQQAGDAGQQPDRDRCPWWVIVVLVSAVVAVSSAGVAFAMVADVPALRLGAWRLQITTALLTPSCVWQFRTLSPELRQRFWRSLGKMALSGVCLALHFSTWVWGLKRTSIVHAYLFVSVTPLLLAAGALLLRQPISVGELGGTAVGMLGAVLLSLGPKSGHEEATIIGDFVTLLGATFIIGYLFVGQDLRKWMPIFCYAVPVTGVAALLMTIGSLVLESATVFPLNSRSVIGYLGGMHILPVLYLGIVPGIVGHQGLNTSLRFLSPLAISLSTATEPIIGSVLAFLLGLTAAPSLVMYIGGLLIISATGIVIVSAHRRQNAETSCSGKQQASSAAQPADSENTSLVRSKPFAC